MGKLLDKPAIQDFLSAIESQLDRPARLYLVGESSLVVEGWRDWTDGIVYTIDSPDPDGLQQMIEELARELRIALVRESPADVIPPAAGSGRIPPQVQRPASDVACPPESAPAAFTLRR